MIFFNEAFSKKRTSPAVHSKVESYELYWLFYYYTILFFRHWKWERNIGKKKKKHIYREQRRRIVDESVFESRASHERLNMVFLSIQYNHFQCATHFRKGVIYRMINVPQILWMYIVHAVCDSNQLEKGERNRKKEDCEKNLVKNRNELKKREKPGKE